MKRSMRDLLGRREFVARCEVVAGAILNGPVDELCGKVLVGIWLARALAAPRLA